MVDLHRHDEFSTFDGFGKSKELAELAKSLGHTALGLSNHGNTNGNIQLYYDCNEVGIKPIMGVECYFQPKFDKEKKGYHLCLFAKNLKGYGNINRIMSEAEHQKYYTSKVTFDLLEKYSDGVICTSACIASFLSQCVLAGNKDMAEKYIKKMKSIFGDDFYVEIQPYKIDNKGTQEKVNKAQMRLAKKLGVKCILTSDSHYGSKDDFDTYIKMHEIAKHDSFNIEETYKERYMPTEKEIYKRFVKMHKNDFDKREKESYGKCLEFGRRMLKNLKEIEDKVEDKMLDGLPLELPSLHDGENTFKVLVKHVQDGLKKKSKYKKEYIERCKEELKVIKYHGFSDYFLMVEDYVNHAKDIGIYVGPGRGSVCNSLVAYALNITTVDSLAFNLEFRRFLRMDKKKLPDVDIDFETARRGEMLDYMIKKYPGNAAQICNYGLYKIDNLINDLAKVCGLDTTASSGLTDEEIKEHKEVVAELKKFIKQFESNDGVDHKGIRESKEYEYYNSRYDNILKHFSKLYQKVRFIGTHAAGVAITGGNITDYSALRIIKDKVTGEEKIYTAYDLGDLDRINLVKFDFLGLKTMESIGELRKLTGKDTHFDITDYINDEKVLEYFRLGKTDGIFQVESRTVKNMLMEMKCDCFEDIVAASAMNRPGPLSLKMPQTYCENKFNKEEASKAKYWDYAKETYGTIIYQEQLMRICTEIGEMTWQEADKVMKIQKRSGQNAAALTGANAKVLEEKDALTDKFIKGAMNHGYTKEEAYEFFQSLLVYTFNRGHAVGYTLITFEEMFYKVYHPTEFWYVKIKYARDEKEARIFCEKAVADGCVVFLPHVNYSKEKTSLRKEDGDLVIQLGLSDIKGVGEKAGAYILEERKKNGIFINFDNFYDRCKSRLVTSAVITKLKTEGAAEFKKKVYIDRVVKYNAALYLRGNE